MKKTTIKAISASLLGLSVLFGSAMQAQDAKAEAILNKLSDKMTQYESVSADFSVNIVDEQSGVDKKLEGNIQVSGDKYRVLLDDNLIISDGDNLWTYSKKSNEVMIDLAEDMYEEEGIKPADVFRIWETGLFKYQHGGEESIEGTTCELIKLYPDDPEDKDFHTIKVFIDSNALEMKKAVIMGKDGSQTIYKLNSFNTDFIKSERFGFDQSKYPGVEVIDNR